MVDKTKKCYRCKGTENLYLVKTYKNGNSTYKCRPCGAEISKAYYDRRKKMVFEHYGEQCACCGESTFEFLSIDHINNDGYLEKLSDGSRLSGVHLYLKIVQDGFPKTFQTLCMNCNFGKRMNRGVCPHLI